MSYANCGMSWDRAGLREYLSALERPAWCRGVTMHHTGTPNLAMRPRGWNAQLMRNVRDGYIRDRRWNRGPHFYPDDTEVWGLTPPTVQGIHAVAFNRDHIGIEVLGDYDKGQDDPLSGRGLACWRNAFWCVAEILRWLRREASEDTINFHRDDPKTSKSCPGTAIRLDWVLAGVRAAAIADGAVIPAAVRSASDERVIISAWLAQRGKKLPIVREADGDVMVGGVWIETALWDAGAQATTALRAELEKDLA